MDGDKKACGKLEGSLDYRDPAQKVKTKPEYPIF